MELSRTELPPVPDSLRALAGRCLANASKPAPRVHSVRWHLRRLAESVRGMQGAVMLRAQPAGTSFVEGGWKNGAEWSALLAESDRAVALLRAAWQELKDTEPATAQVLATWREAYGIPVQDRIDEDSEAFWLLLVPALTTARGQTQELMSAAITALGAVTTRYFHLLRSTQATTAYGPQPKRKAA